MFSACLYFEFFFNYLVFITRSHINFSCMSKCSHGFLESGWTSFYSQYHREFLISPYWLHGFYLPTMLASHFKCFTINDHSHVNITQWPSKNNSTPQMRSFIKFVILLALPEDMSKYLKTIIRTKSWIYWNLFGEIEALIGWHVLYEVWMDLHSLDGIWQNIVIY